MLLGLLITLAYVPGWTGASIPTGWAALSFVLPWLIWRRVEMTLLHYLGLMFLAYAFLSIEWAPRREDAIYELWHWSLFALAFLWGTQHGLRPLWRGLALGCGVSSIVAVAQWWGWGGVLNLDWEKFAGLYYNNAVAGAVAAVVIIGLISEGMFLQALLPLPLLILSASRGAWLAVIGTWIVTGFVNSEGWKDRFFLSLFALAPVIAALLWWNSDSDFIRLEIWKQLLTHLSLFGAGAGATQTIYMTTPSAIFHIEHGHNDYLTLAYEYGLGILPLALFVWLLLEARDVPSWSPFLCSLILALYFWPLEGPVTGFLLAVVAGRLAGELAVAWQYGLGRGLGGLVCNRPGLSTAGRGALSIQLGS